MTDASRPAQGQALLRYGMWILLGAYVVGLSWHGPRYSTLIDGWLGTLAQWVPAVVCGVACTRARRRRREIALVTLAVALFAAGNTFYVLRLSHLAAPPVPSWADAGYLSFYPLALVAIACAVRRELAGTSFPVWRDSALGALAATAGLAVLLRPVMEAASGSATTEEKITAMAYPVADLLLITAIAGVCVLKGLRLERHWLVLIMGLSVFAAADVFYALRVVRDTYVVGTPLDAGWAIGLALVAMWADTTVRESDTRKQRAGTLGVPAAASTVALVVLIAGTQTRVSQLAVVLSSVVLAMSVWWALSAFRQLRTLAEIRRHAETDELTGLANRRVFYAEVARRLTDRPDRASSLLLLDLDRFKEINESLGHQVGDRLLVEIGARLTSVLRPGDLLARLGGDEFGVLLERTGETAALATAHAMRAAVSEPFVAGGVTLRSDVSIGIAVYPHHGADLSLLLSGADIAMGKSKDLGEGPAVFSGADAQLGLTRLRTLEEFRIALQERQLVLHYQPKLDLRTGAVRGVEALVRWQHPARGLLYPDTFLDIVEDAGLMPRMTDYVLEHALDQAFAWHQGGRPLKIAVNLSARSLVDADLPSKVATMLSNHKLTACALQLEITESVLMGDRDRAHGVLTQLRADGVSISIDDFGTGYCSLAYLRDLPIDELKLDRSFILALRNGPRAGDLVASTVALAHSLGLRMVAEGVETEETLSELVSYGCDEAQGYHISRPVPAAELDSWLDLHHAIGPRSRRAPITAA